MAEIVRMPKLSDTMVEGVVSKWHKKVGDAVKTGELLADIETDKATMEFESFQEGVLLHIGVAEGAAAKVDSILAILGKKGENIKDLLASEVVVEAKEPVITEPIKTQEAPKLEVKPVEVTKQVVFENSAQKSNDGMVKISPLAKKLAEERNINPMFLKGSGDFGRIIKRDIDQYQGQGFSAPQIESFTEVAVSQMRKTIARRLSESKFTAPHFYLTIDLDMDEVVKARAIINETASSKISFNDLVIKAVAASLKKNPAVNSSWLEDKIRYNEHIHIGVAIAVEDGLVVPVLKFANTKTLSAIATEVKSFAEKAQTKKLQPQDFSGNTFTISNLGMFGIEEFTAIINTPDACILAVGAIRQEPVVKNNQIIIGNRMKVTLSCDHRVVDGAAGAKFLQTLKKYIENPVLLLGEQMI
jgi:pyruvate dehydrogenase E2 component (dihydrolipoamide acetyltransferase)